MTTQTVNTHQTRWGYVATDYETYQKLRRLQYLWLLSKRAEDKYWRWAAKEPQNRVSRRWVRNADGQKIHCVKGDPIPEPRSGFPKFYDHSNVKSGEWRYFSWGDLAYEDYRRARFPKATPGEVEPVRIALKKIDGLLREAEAWHAE